MLDTESPLISPLRYPGSKRRFTAYLSEVLKLNSLKPKLFVEPFAGGASVSLQLLQNGDVEAIALGERDPLVAAFWKTVFEDTEWLVEQIGKVKVSLDKWDEFRKKRFGSQRDRALACIFLNRTSFSGILSDSAGPIGGRTQESDYKIGCRFPVETLVQRIERIAKLKDRVFFVRQGDYRDTIEKARALPMESKDVVYYLDPPFYEKADHLYRFFFQGDDHKNLHDCLMSLDSHWILSYDSAKPIVSMYSHNGRGPKHVDQLYSVSGDGNRVQVKELIITSLPKLPRKTKLWKSNEEWSLPSAHHAESKN